MPKLSARPRLAIIGLATGLLVGMASPVAAQNLPGAPNCPIFPATNVWNKRVDTLPVRTNSSRLVDSIGVDRYVHPDFGSFAGYGIPFNIVNQSTPRSQVTIRWDDESEPGPYPIPANPKIEGAGEAGDRHILMIDRDACRLYELYRARKVSGQWLADSGAIWDLRSNALRPAGWTSADAAGLPILPGLVRYDEVAAGSINHALRFTAEYTRTRYIYPARHEAGDSDAKGLPPMGLRVRLKANVDVSRFGPQSRVILTALKRYGMILADNGSPWFISGASNPNFDDDDLHELQTLHGSDLEVVDTSALRNG